ncbi:hypothetical protein CC86DRAFT_373227 [Ophiobolus disseminans]|uniref:Uncharacterized protein n=1 Tax=Ophiobolus disseminans TaxID=1469910 RepID=A0A6A6ZMM0_9PLEO|nr:hypothetical protein CC86DRAFT_373227 [Ophiobolus disseminans]
MCSTCACLAQVLSPLHYSSFLEAYSAQHFHASLGLFNRATPHPTSSLCPSHLLARRRRLQLHLSLTPKHS